tara:strand:- start:991 stop:1440 length:450 start_codon:yes stop_codon:yes gene_type:complete
MDSAGRVTKPQIPAFMASGSAAWTSLATDAIVAFNDASSGSLFNNGGHYNTSTYAFVVPVAGIYSFSINCYTANSDQVNAFGPRVNGSKVLTVGTNPLYTQHGEDASFDEHAAASFLLNLEVNDSVAIYTITASDIYIQASQFCGHLIG